MRTLLLALKDKILNNPKLSAKFGNQVFIVDDPNDPDLMTTANVFPFLVLHDGDVAPEYEPSQTFLEKVQVQLFIYQQIFRTAGQNTIGDDGVLALSELLISQLNGDNNFTGTVYDGDYIIEAQWKSRSASEYLRKKQQPMAVRQKLIFQYMRDTQVVLT